MRIIKGFTLACAAALVAATAFASPHGTPAPKRDWSFQGPFGTYDKDALKRGLQVYREVCAVCHSLDLVAYRNLRDIGLNEAEVKEIAADYDIPAGPNADGETHDEDGMPLMRAGRPSDRFAAPFANDTAAKVANNGKVPPDLSLVAKSRIGGPNYVYALLTGYKETPPEGVDVGDGNYNVYFPGNRIVMAPPLDDDVIEYVDGTKATKAQLAEDITQFLMWTAEPKLEERKRLGLKAWVFIAVFFVLMIFVKRRVWSDVH